MIKGTLQYFKHNQVSRLPYKETLTYKVKKHWDKETDKGCIICGKVTAQNSIYCQPCINFGVKYKTNS